MDMGGKSIPWEGTAHTRALRQECAWARMNAGDRRSDERWNLGWGADCGRPGEPQEGLGLGSKWKTEPLEGFEQTVP